MLNTTQAKAAIIGAKILTVIIVTVKTDYSAQAHAALEHARTGHAAPLPPVRRAPRPLAEAAALAFQIADAAVRGVDLKAEKKSAAMTTKPNPSDAEPSSQTADS